jgi:hypothetical protein
MLVAGLALLAAAAPPRGTLDAFADALVERARPHLTPGRDLDVAVAVAGPWPRLGDELAALLVARLRALGLRSVTRADGDHGWARAAGYERLLRLDLDVSNGRLRANGSVTALSSSPWAPAEETRAHLYAELPLDAELRAFMPAIATPPGRWQARGVPVGDVDLLALDVGDVDGDGRPELVGVTAAEVIVWGWDGARLVERRRFPLGGRPAAARPRQDVASVVVTGGFIVAHASPFADGVRRGRDGQSQPARGFGFPGLDVTCELGAGVDWFAGCAPATGLPERFWAAAGLRNGGRASRAVVDAAGTLWVQLGPSGGAGGAERSGTMGPSGGAGGAERSGTMGPSGGAGGAERSGTMGPAGGAGGAERSGTMGPSGGAGGAERSGTVGLAAPALATPLVPLSVRNVGAQLALAALDRGEFVATSEPVWPGEPDALVVRALAPGLPVAYRVDRLPGGVRALAAGDVDGDGRAEFVAAVRDRAARRTELWIVN